MKFYVPNECIDQIDNDGVCKWLQPADFDGDRRCLILDQWANGWIFEADESFNTFFTITTGKRLPTVTDHEYQQFVMDRVAFFSKERASEFRRAWIEFRPKINNR